MARPNPFKTKIVKTDDDRPTIIAREVARVNALGHDMAEEREPTKYVDPQTWGIVYRCRKCGADLLISHTEGQYDTFGVANTVCGFSPVQFEICGVTFTVELDGHGSGNIGSTGNVFVADDDRYDEDGEPVDLMIREQDAIESLILAHACAGVDIASEAYQAGLRTAIEQIGMNAG